MLEGEDGGGQESKEWKNLGEVNLKNYKSLFVDKRQGIHAETSACNLISLCLQGTLVGLIIILL